jgi:hypothetical protein
MKLFFAGMEGVFMGFAYEKPYCDLGKVMGLTLVYCYECNVNSNCQSNGQINIKQDVAMTQPDLVFKDDMASRSSNQVDAGRRPRRPNRRPSAAGGRRPTRTNPQRNSRTCGKIFSNMIQLTKIFG